MISCEGRGEHEEISSQPRDLRLVRGLKLVYFLGERVLTRRVFGLMRGTYLLPM